MVEENGIYLLSMKETKFKHTEIGLIPEDWEVKKISEVCRNFTGLTYNPENIANYGTLVLRSSNIQNNELTFMDNVYVDMEIPNRAIAKAGDVLVCVRNGSSQLIGKSALITPEAEGMAFGAFMTVLRTSSIDNVYLLQSWRHKRTQDQIHETFGATINQITSKDFNRILIPIPPAKDEQKRIATALYDIDTLIRNLDRTIEKKKNIRQGAMEQLLSGKKRLPGFKGEWGIVHFEDLYKFAKEGGTPSTSIPENYSPATIPFAKIEDLYGHYLTKTNSYISEVGLNNSSAWLVPAGNLLLSNGATLGEVTITAVTTATKQGILGLVIKKELFSTEFLYYVFKMNDFKRKMETITTHGTMDCAYLKDLKGIELYIPLDLQEQRAIADTLTAMDDEIAVLQMERDKYANIRSGMMDDLLSGAKRI